MVKRLWSRLPGTLLFTVLELAGFGALVYAGFLVWTVLGFAALGIALIVVANGSQPADPGTPQ